MKISIYGHSGSYNHGNEAIVRGVTNIFPDAKLTLYSFDPIIDKKFCLNEVCEIKPFYIKPKRYSFRNILSILAFKIYKDRHLRNRFRLKKFFTETDGVYLLEAGDQYCENDSLRKHYAFINRKINKRGGKTVMLGCTINEEYLTDNKVIADLNNYSLIITRESITYNSILKAGVKTKVILAPDPAFAMQAKVIDLPKIFQNPVIGINCGFLKQGNEQHYEMMLKNTENLIEYIIEKTNYSIALIPHVNWSYELSDKATLDILYDKFKESNRIDIIEEHSAPEQKYIMSKCKIMIALRTHVAIPSIAAGIPTLVTGYKTKSTGIVQDIFQNKYKLLAHLSSLKTDNDYIDYFKWIEENYNSIFNFMNSRIPDYLTKIELIRKEIIELIEDEK